MNAASYKNLFLFVAVTGLFYLQAVMPALAKTSLNQPIVRLNYGKTGLVTYDLDRGEFCIFQYNKVFVFNAVSSVIVNGKTITSKDYSLRRYSHIEITDGFGKGQKDVILLFGIGLPGMIQTFYCYPGREFIQINVALQGKNLESNYISPLTGNFTPVKGDAKSLFVPFDNDTFISYESRPFSTSASDTSSEVGVVFDNTSRKGLIAGSVEHGTWRTGVRTAYKPNNNQLEIWGGYSAEKITRSR